MKLTVVIIFEEHARASIIVQISVFRTSAGKLVSSIIVLTATSTHHFPTAIIKV